MFSQDDTLLRYIEKKGEKDEVSSRTMRIPIRIQGGIPFSQINPDSGDLGLGNNDVYDAAVNLTPVWFNTAVTISKLASVATDSDKKAVENVMKEAFISANKQLRSGIESLLNTDGSGTIDVVTAVNGATITTNNPNAFNEGSSYQVFSALGGTNRGSFTVVTTDPNGGVIVANAAVSGTTIGDLLVINGAAGTAATSLFGLEYHNVDTNSGSWLGLSRSTYPNKLKSPHVAAGGAALSPQIVRQLKLFMERALGEGAKVDSLVAHMGLEMAAAWEDATIAVTTVQQQAVTGDESLDLLKKNLPATIGGLPIIRSIKAVRGRIDFLNLEHWGTAEIQPIDMFDVGGQTQFQTYGSSGGLNANELFYYWTGLQVWTDNPRANGFVDGISIPSGY